MTDLQKSASYSTTDQTADAIDRVSRRLTGELRYKARSICPAVPLSSDWYDQGNTFDRLATLAEIEEKDQRAATGTTHIAPNTPKQTTVWEREDLVVRTLVEEGKVNLIMRILVEFKQFFISSIVEKKQLTNVVHAMYKYEASLGTVFRVTLTAVEAVQTLDVRALLDHVNTVFEYVLSDGWMRLRSTSVAAASGGDEKEQKSIGFLSLQDGLCVQYLQSLMSHIDKISEPTVMGKIESTGLIGKLVMASTKMLDALQSEDYQLRELDEEEAFRNGLISFFVMFLHTETVRAKLSTFFPDKELKKRFIVLIEPLVQRLIADQAGKEDAIKIKSRLRPLTDAILRWK